MSECCHDALGCRPEELCRALAIHTQKITDSCRDKDCIEDLRVYLTQESQNVLDAAGAARVRSAELIHTSIDIAPVSFHPNHYAVDLTFYYKILADAAVSPCRPAAICGLAMFGKRAVLCGENAAAHIFRSDCSMGSSSLPTAVVEVLDPMVLGSKVCQVRGCESCSLSIPGDVQAVFGEQLVLSGDKQRLYVTLGQFSVIRLERPAQIIVPIVNYALPTKECCADPAGCAEDPCALFDRVPFPAEAFTPTGCDRQGESGQSM
jgi:hypothetical protein